MRRSIAVALALICSLASVADAKRVLVIRQSGTIGNESSNAASKQLGNVMSTLDLLGVDYDVVNQNAITGTLSKDALKTGVVYYDSLGNISQTYGAMIHLGFTVSGTGRVAGYNPSPLTTRSGWATIPHIFFGPQVVSGSTIFTQTATCSTGVAAGRVLSSSAGWTPSGLAMHMVGNTFVWSGNSDGSVYYRNDGSAGLILGPNSGSVVQKSRVVIGASAVSARDSGVVSCGTACDSAGRALDYFNSPSADTAVIWTRERFNGDTAITVFAPTINIGNGSVAHTGHLVAMALAIADSATRLDYDSNGKGQLIGQKPNWSPTTVAFVVDGAFSRSTSDVGIYDWNSHTTQPNSDTLLVKAGIDSLASLGIPITVGVNVDSVDAYPSEKAWWARLTRARFYPSLRTASGSTVLVPSANTSTTLAVDPFGYNRSRDFITSARYTAWSACDGTDTTLSCQLEYARRRLSAYPEYSQKLSAFIVAPMFDYIPFGRQSASLDSFEVALMRSGYTCAVSGVMAIGSLGRVSWALDSGSPQSLVATDPKNWNNLQRRSMRNDFRWLSAREINENAVQATKWSSHTMNEEWTNAIFNKLWYNQDLLYYQHNFRTKCNVIIIRPGDLGFQPKSTRNPLMPGWWCIKWTVNEILAINAFAGRTVINIGYPEDIQL